MAITTIAQLARLHGRERADATAVWFGDQQVTYGELDQRSNRVGNALLADSVEAQDRVAFLDKNTTPRSTP
jgi:acyl-CoA synthetase (AMP-forming)/AMP-acid ligase II